MRRWLTTLLLGAALALGTPIGSAALAADGPTMQAAPEPIHTKPTVPPPAGGWWTEEGLYARVSGAPEDRATVRRLADHAARAVPALADRLGVPAGGTVEIYLAPSQADFGRMQPGAPPEWADGTAWPSHGLIFLRAPSARPGTAEPLETVLDHELVHVLLGRAFAPRPVPRWLQEGLAQYYAGEIGPEEAQALFTARLGGEVSLARLAGGFRGDPIQARAAYAASADLVAFVAGRHGESAIRALVARMAVGQGLEEALSGATGVPAADLEAAWRRRWEGPLPWIAALAREEVFWGVAAGLFVVGFLRVRGRTRRRLERMEDEDRWMDAFEARGTVQ